MSNALAQHLASGGGTIIDRVAFDQILNMDDPGEIAMAQSLVDQFLIDGDAAMENLESALQDEDLGGLSQQAHLLQGSSATLGLFPLRDACEKLGQYGDLHNKAAGTSLTEEEALSMLKEQFPVVQEQFALASSWLRTWEQLQGGGNGAE